MTVELVNLGHKFIDALSEEDDTKRDLAVDKWLQEGIPALHAAVEEDVRNYIDWIKSQWDGKWEGFRRKMDRYPVKKLGVEVRYHLTSQAQLEMEERRRKRRQGARTGSPSGGSDDWDDDGEGGHSSNDDRSDSMNPNNPAHQAAMDNRNDQMNPNNPAYHSSRRH